MQLQTKKEVNLLTLLLSVTYMVSYITRINYGAVISEMERATQLSRSLLSMSLTGSFITYGAGQVISGFLGDKTSPKRLIFLGLSLSVLMNLLIPLCPNAYLMLAVWCVNGFAQSLMWPPMARIMAELLSEDDYKKTSVKVSWGSSVGTIAVYLIAPLLISAFGWRAVFICSALCGAVMLLFWQRFAPEMGGRSITLKQPSAEKQERSERLLSPMILTIMLAIILQGMLRDGVTTWMPSYIAETYQLSNLVAILTGVVLPLFSIVSFQATELLYRKRLKNPLSCAALLFGIGTAAAAILWLLSGRNAAFSVLFSALLTGCMHGINMMLICMIPPFYSRQGSVSTVSGLLNACTYIGSAISTYGIALLSETLGWRFTLGSWFVIAASGMMLCLLCIRPWKKTMGT